MLRAAVILLGLTALGSVASRGEAAILANGFALTGDVESRTLFRVPDPGRWSLVQQRNTLRLEVEALVARGERFHGGGRAPLVERLSLFAYSRFVYDTVYDLAPGTRLRTQDGSVGGRIEDFAPSRRTEIALESSLREVYADLDLTGPLHLRIGRQQIAWGESVQFRALDSVNALDLTWHSIWETSGLVGKGGFNELRKPIWALRGTWDLGVLGPFSGVWLEAFDAPFGFEPSEARFLPAPWSLPVRDPFRAGLVLDAGDEAGLPAGIVELQPCFDRTGNPEPNAAARPDFTHAAATGDCPSRGRTESRLRQGLYDRRNPFDVNQLGVRLGGSWRAGELTLAYLHRRHLGADLPGSGIARVHFAAVEADPAAYLEPAPHATTDPVTGETRFVDGYLRVPMEFYYPYVHVFGMTASWLAQAIEVAVTPRMPVATLDRAAAGIRRATVLSGAVTNDLPVYSPSLNLAAPWLLVLQTNVQWFVDHEPLRFDASGRPLDGDVQLPSSNRIPGQFGAEDRLDRLKEVEVLTLASLTTSMPTPWGVVAPDLGWASDWANAPSMAFLAVLHFLPAPGVILSPGLRLFTTFGRTVDDPWGVGRARGRSEAQLQWTLQF